MNGWAVTLGVGISAVVAALAPFSIPGLLTWLFIDHRRRSGACDPRRLRAAEFVLTALCLLWLACFWLLVGRAALATGGWPLRPYIDLQHWVWVSPSPGAASMPILRSLTLWLLPLAVMTIAPFVALHVHLGDLGGDRRRPLAVFALAYAACWATCILLPGECMEWLLE